MERPKGYGGRPKRNQVLDNVIVGNGDRQWRVENSHHSCDNNKESGNLANTGIHARDKAVQDNSDAFHEGEIDGSLPLLVLPLLEEQVAQHPAFICIMQQLQALEQSEGTSGMVGDAVDKCTPSLPTSTPNIVEENDISKDLVEATIVDNDNIPMSRTMDTFTQLLGEDEVG